MEWNLEARALSRRTADGVWLIRNASLLLEPGESVGVQGASGAGKTVLLRALAALDPLESGSLRWAGEEVTGDGLPSYRGRVVYLHQRPALVEGSVEHNLALPFELRLHRVRSFNRERASVVLESLGKPPAFLTKAQAELSGGEAQIAALARALLIEPAVLLLDEPTASLDAMGAATVGRALRAWRDEAPTRRALVCVAHDLTFFGSMTERCVRMHGGTLTEVA